MESCAWKSGACTASTNGSCASKLLTGKTRSHDTTWNPANSCVRSSCSSISVAAYVASIPTRVPNPAMNVDPLELEKFSQLAHRWWDRESEFKPLHDINPL